MLDIVLAHIISFIGNFAEIIAVLLKNTKGPIVTPFKRKALQPFRKWLMRVANTKIRVTETYISQHCRELQALMKEAKKKGDRELYAILYDEMKAVEEIFLQNNVRNISINGDITKR